MQLTSPAFKHSSSIPALFTCDGENINPPLNIKDVPSQAKSLVLIFEDPDVPSYVRKDGLYIHWVVFNMDVMTKTIEEGIPPKALFGINTSEKTSYVGPCPPDKEHRYFFKLYALKESLSLKTGATKDEVMEAMSDLVIEETELMGLYDRARS
ncbi:MAG: YbhB/YbcL family Raf kinase inhibitor-like protein [Parachlamydiales bacterium]|nr:YbhB/YbcL family Raf kinase inhibitor-like protein [Parachlamydiales bacterium]